MATIRSDKSLEPKQMPVDGRAIVINDSATISANPVATDNVKFRIPAGFDLSVLRFRVTDMDSSTGLAGSIGYAPVRSDSSLAANTTYFQAAGALGQAAALIDCNFPPITFQEDVDITITWTVTATGFAAGTIGMTAIGNAKGPR